MQSIHTTEIQTNPTETQHNLSSNGGLELARLKGIASAQRVINRCLFSWLIATAFNILHTDIAPLFLIAVTITAVAGVVRMTRDLGTTLPWKIAFSVAAFIPYVSLLVMTVLTGRATKVLQIAGYKVGLLGVRESDLA